MDNPTQEMCPESPYGDTHHLVLKGGAPTCEYCGKTRSELVNG